MMIAGFAYFESKERRHIKGNIVRDERIAILTARADHDEFVKSMTAAQVRDSVDIAMRKHEASMEIIKRQNGELLGLLHDIRDSRGNENAPKVSR